MFLPDGAIRFRTGEPDLSSLKDQEYDWTRSVYSGACEQIPHDIPKPLGKHGQTTHYVDANLHHDLATGKVVTAVLHFLNQTPIDAYSKRHHLVSYHRVREAIAAKYISFHWKDGKSNPADILSKHWEFATVWPMLKPILFWRGETATQLNGSDRIPATTPGAEPPRDARDSGSARSHSTHLETSSSDRPKMVTYTEPQTVLTYMSVTFTRRTLRMPSFTRATHAQPSLSDFPWRDSDFWRVGLLTRDDPGGTKFSHFPPKQNYQTNTLFDIRANANNINPTDKMNVVLTLIGLPQRSQS